jgi:threonine/homoserine/homoserine lactone efflux protein
MLKAIFEGVVWGLILSFMIGPVFFGLLHTSIHKGFKKALVYATGVAFSDTFFIVITYLGIAGFMDDEQFRKILLLIGGFIMIAFGLYYILKKAADSIELKDKNDSIKKTNVFIKGFLLNAINPSVFIFWIGMVSFAGITFHNDKYLILIFFIVTVGTVFSTDILKAYIAHKIKIYFTNRLLNKMNKVLGSVILLAGLSLVYDFVKNYFS